MLNKVLDVFRMIGKKKLIMVLAIVIVVIALVVVSTTNSSFITASRSTDGKEFSSEYEILNGKLTDDGKEYPKVNISDDNVTKYSNVEEILSLFDGNGDGVVYFGYSTCLYCRTAVQVLYDVAENTELDKIYYLNIEEQNATEYSKLYEALGEELVQVDENGDKSIIAPLVIFIASGNVVSYQKGTLSSQVSPYDALDDSQIDGLGEIYRYGINDVLASVESKKRINEVEKLGRFLMN